MNLSELTALTETPGSLHGDSLRRIEGWLSLPSRDRAELLQGRIVYKAMASIEHGSAVVGITEQIGRFNGPPAGARGGWWLSQEVDLFLAGQGLRPDLIGWRVDRYARPPNKTDIGNKHLGVYVTPPDWVCEVLSGSTRSRDEPEGIKWQAYHEASVGHYWLVDLSLSQITVYQRTKQGYEAIEVAGCGAIKPLPPFQSIEFIAQRVFVLATTLRAQEDT